ncbi:MAG: hypothetical protein NZL95_10085 [Chitinophagales bacterium]|nr:hypothetical protein [Chitinophagales bacterium]MDW8428881.1 hypothetical protein [Chitinophagales bacterium]
MGINAHLTLLTDSRYLTPQPGNDYVSNIFLEDKLLTEALERLGYHVQRTNWDNPNYDWSATHAAVFRTTWDYFHRADSFRRWLKDVCAHTRLINDYEVVMWNMDKTYLLVLQQRGLAIPPTLLVHAGSSQTLKGILSICCWEEVILKPAISGAARHTYRFTAREATAYEPVFQQLIGQEAVLLQQFQPSVLKRGEAALMFFDGRYSHAVLKRARPGDFRVQDDFGGTVHPYQPAADEIELARKALQCSPQPPVYGRVDLLWNEAGKPLVSELELIEPELWLRCSEPAAALFADALHKALQCS